MTEDGALPPAPNHTAGPLSGRVAMAGLLVVTLLVGVGIGVFVGRSDSHKSGKLVSLTGSISAREGAAQRLAKGAPCASFKGFTDLRPGASVLVRDGQKKLLANGFLDPGRSNGSGRCVYTFTVQRVPANSDFYEVTAGNVEQRTGLIFSRADLESKGWKIDLSV